MDENIILMQDSYKLSHWEQYPPGVTAMSSYLESRGGEHDRTVFFGLQYLLTRYLSRRVSVDDVDEADRFARLHGVPFNRQGWTYVARELDGRLPVRVRAVHEGSVVPTSNVLMTVESTDPRVPWVVSSLETVLMRLWYPCTVATRSWHLRESIRSFLVRTSDDPEGELPYKLHDFGARGVSSSESAGVGGSAHLVSFLGSDTIEGVRHAQEFYGVEGGMPGFSVPASEHSTVTMWGRAREAEAYAHMLDLYRDLPVFACVSDSYDLGRAARDIWGGELRQRVVDRHGTLVVRPDSGDPVETCAMLVTTLASRFGVTRNGRGYDVLNHGVRVIQGDGVTPRTVVAVLERLEGMGLSATNVSFGMGGGLLQQLDRDTQRFAFKCSWARVDGRDVDVSKDPVTDPGKRSKRGRLELVDDPLSGYRTVRREEMLAAGAAPVMRDVFRDGHVLARQSFDDVRARAAGALAGAGR